MSSDERVLEILNHPDYKDRRPNGGEPPYDGEMEPRVKALEEAMTQVRQDVAVMRSNYATKDDLKIIQAEMGTVLADVRADIQKSIGENAKWLHTAMLAMFSAFVLGAIGLLFTIWNATKQIGSPPPQSAPIIIQVPQPMAPPAPAAPPVKQTP